MSEWECEQSAFTRASRMVVWAYWTDLSNHAKMEPGVVRIELDGPFATGTTGRTIGVEFEQEWELTDVVEGLRFGIAGFTPEGKGMLRFLWDLEDEGGGTRVTYRISASGPEVDRQLEVLSQMEIRAPEGLARLVADLDGLAQC